MQRNCGERKNYAEDTNVQNYLNQNNAFTDRSLAPDGYLNKRLNMSYNHLLVPYRKKESICQLHR